MVELRGPDRPTSTDGESRRRGGNRRDEKMDVRERGVFVSLPPHFLCRDSTRRFIEGHHSRKHRSGAGAGCLWCQRGVSDLSNSEYSISFRAVITAENTNSSVTYSGQPLLTEFRTLHFRKHNPIFSFLRKILLSEIRTLHSL